MNKLISARKCNTQQIMNVCYKGILINEARTELKYNIATREL